MCRSPRRKAANRRRTIGAVARWKCVSPGRCVSIPRGEPSEDAARRLVGNAYLYDGNSGPVSALARRNPNGIRGFDPAKLAVLLASSCCFLVFPSTHWAWPASPRSLLFRAASARSPRSIWSIFNPDTKPPSSGAQKQTSASISESFISTFKAVPGASSRPVQRRTPRPEISRARPKRV